MTSLRFGSLNHTVRSNRSTLVGASSSVIPSCLYLQQTDNEQGINQAIMGDDRKQKRRSSRSHSSRRHRRSRSRSSRVTQDAARDASSGACGGLFSDCRPDEHSRGRSGRDDDDSGSSPERRSSKERSREKRHQVGFDGQDELEIDDSREENFEVYPTKSVERRLGRVDSNTYQCESANTNVVYQNHPTLPHMSASVRYENSAVRVFQQEHMQIVLEDRIIEHNEEDEEGGGSPGVVIFGRRKTREITVKKVEDATIVDSGLKVVYTLVCVMFGAILFISCLQILLFVLLDTLPQEDVGGDSSSNYPQHDDIVSILCALLSLPGFVFGFASIMAFASAFICDNWRSNRVIQAVGGRDYSSSKSTSAMILSQWLSFSIFILVPAITAAVSLLLGLEGWWTYTLLVWYSTVFAYFAYYASIIIQYEVKTCLDLVRKTNGYDPSTNLFFVVRRAILLRQMHAFSGYLSSAYIINGDEEIPKAGSFTLSRRHDAERETRSLYTKITLTRFCSQNLYTQLDMPVPMKSLEDMIGATPVITSSSWTLDKLYCPSGTSSRNILVLNGPAAVTDGQRRSSMVFAIIANSMAMFLVISFLMWANTSIGVTVVVAGVTSLTWIPSIISILKTSKLYSTAARRTKDKRVDSILRKKGDLLSETIYHVHERSRVTIPCDGICWALFFSEATLFFIIPLIILFYIGNMPVALLFLVVAFCSGVRRYLNPTVILKEMGTFDYLTSQRLRIDETEAQIDRPREDWVPRWRASNILGSISNGRSLHMWRFIFWLFALIFAAVTISAAVSHTSPSKEIESINRQLQRMVADFEYRPSSDPYPMCDLPQDFGVPTTENALADATFLSSLAYINGKKQMQMGLDKWYGANVATNQDDIVSVFKGAWGGTSLKYKLIDFNQQAGFAVVSIRGADTTASTLAGMKVWSGVALSQTIQALMPLGNAWAPLLDKVVALLSRFEAHSTVDFAAAYEEVSAFVQTLLHSGEFSEVVLTGHGFGGGVAFISGAQNELKAVSLSSPSIVQLGSTVNPPLSQDQVHRNVLNIAPERDLIANIGTRVHRQQEIQCRSGANDLLGCHDPIRSLCEIQYKCGSFGRPILCACHESYGYDMPVAIGNRTFEEACSR